MSLLDGLQTAIFKTSRNFGGIVAQVTIEEHHTDEMEITSHPVEVGASITDHAYLRPAELTVRMAWNGGGIQANIASVQAIAAGSYGNPLQGYYNQLLALQATRKPFAIVTGKRSYKNMLISSLQTITDEKTANVLMVTARCKQIIMVETQTVSIAPRDNQASPELTDPIIPVSRQQLAPAPNFNTQGYNAGARS